MDIIISPSQLSGEVEIPASKSIAHRLLIAAALADGETVIHKISRSKDIEATASALTALGAAVKFNGTDCIVKGIASPPENCIIDCCESGSTLRFLIPVAAALGANTAFYGAGKLPSRPITPYIREMSDKGIAFTYNNTMPFDICGKLEGGVYRIEGDISSQFITGLLFALPLLSSDSEIHLTSPLQSKPYVDITLDVLSKFGIFITETDYGYHICGNRKYVLQSDADTTVEGDFSQAAFFYIANLLGNEVNVSNLSDINHRNSPQGDRKILDIVSEIVYNKNGIKKMKAFSIDVADIPDLVPILAVLGCFCDDTSYIRNAARLAIKESNRLEATADMLNRLGGKVIVGKDSLTVYPVGRFCGGEVYSHNDHRIVMAAAIAATASTAPVIIHGAEAVNKSYPAFFDDFTTLGGKINVINLEQ